MGEIQLIVIGAVLVSPALQATFAVALGPIGNWANATLGDRSTSGLYGQFALGVLLGAVWTPCVGPTLGAASLLAAHGKNLASVAGTMFVFGAGTSVSLALLGLLSRSALMAWRSRMLGAGHAAKTAMGGALAVLGVVILAGMDKPLEAILVDYSPDWLTQLTTLY